MPMKCGGIGESLGANYISILADHFKTMRVKACQKSGPGSLACSGEAFFWLDVWLLCI
jgi:hypothetical protein